MKDTRRSDEFIDFDEIRSELSSAQIGLSVDKESLSKNTGPVAYIAHLKAEIIELETKIPQLEAILATEPPAPELPPRQPLIKVSGVLEEFSVQKVKGYFTDREYSPEAFAQHEANQQLGGLLLAMVGNAAGSAVTSQTQVRSSDPCDFVRGKINGTPFYGWLGKTHVRVGDTVELAAMPKGGQLVVYALALPALRTLSITPRCHYGREGAIGFERRYGIPLFSILFGLLLLYFAISGVPLIGVFQAMLMFIAILTVLFLLSARSTRKKPNPSSLLTENIFTTLGVDNPKKVDLNDFTKKKLKALAKQPPVVSDREMPARSAGQDYLFYY